jgi:hypothetical protein
MPKKKNNFINVLKDELDTTVVAPPGKVKAFSGASKPKKKILKKPWTREELKEKLALVNYQYCFDVDYDRIDSLDREDTYNRNSTLENVRITDMRADSILYSILGILKSNRMHLEFVLSKEVLYILERYISQLTIEDFNVDVRYGYYGEEIYGVFLERGKDEVLNIIFIEKSKPELRKLLLKEYGFLLDYLKTSDFSILEVEIDDVCPSNEFVKTGKPMYKKYNMKTISKLVPVAICRQGGYSRVLVGKRTIAKPMYTIIDGHNRIMEAKKQGVKKVSILVVS